MPRTKGLRDVELVRYTMLERVVHWTVALSFVYLTLSGLALYSPRLYWLASLLGGGTTIRVWHPYAGVVFFLALAMMFYKWKRCMLFYPEDWEWLKNIKSYITHTEKGLPEIGRFNPGQKILFWLMVLSGLFLLLSGIPIWFPEKFSREVRLVSFLAHEVSTLLSIAGLIVHLYMGLLAVPGSLGAMTRGVVKESWALAHHPRWYRRMTRRGVKEV